MFLFTVGVKPESEFDLQILKKKKKKKKKKKFDKAEI